LAAVVLLAILLALSMTLVFAPKSDQLPREESRRTKVVVYALILLGFAVSGWAAHAELNHLHPDTDDARPAQTQLPPQT
jgi:hypothetical protein